MGFSTQKKPNQPKKTKASTADLKDPDLIKNFVGGSAKTEVSKPAVAKTEQAQPTRAAPVAEKPAAKKKPPKTVAAAKSVSNNLAPQLAKFVERCKSDTSTNKVTVAIDADLARPLKVAATVMGIPQKVIASQIIADFMRNHYQEIKAKYIADL